LNYFKDEAQAIANLIIPGNQGQIEWNYGENGLKLDWVKATSSQSSEKKALYKWI